MRLLREIIAVGVRNPVLANLSMLFVIAGGLMATTRMVRESYPEFSVDHVEIVTAWPGASTDDVERAICNPIEDAIEGVEGVREISSAANADFGSHWLALHLHGADADEVIKDVRDRIDQIKTFPPDSERPTIRELTIRAEVLSIAIHGDVPERTLKEYAKEVREDLLGYSQISQVAISGIREDEILIEFSEESLRAYSLSFEQIMAVIARSSLDLPAGVIRTAGEEVTLRVTGQRLLAAEYEDLVVIDRPNALVRLGDIAEIRDGFSEVVSSGRFDGERAVVVNVFKTPQEDTTEISRTVNRYAAAKKETLPERVGMTVWADSSLEVESRLAMLVKNGVAGIILVFFTLAIFLETRVAWWVAVGIPVSFAGALMLMFINGQTINMISLFALIMVSGIIVDDAIVIAENIHRRKKLGESPELASIEGSNDVVLPVMGSSLTTVITFIPLMFVLGAMGKLIHVLPVVVIGAIAASAFEAFFVLPSHLCNRTLPGAKQSERTEGRVRKSVEAGVDWVITSLYLPVYRLALRYRLITVSIAAASLLLVVGLVLGERVAFVLYPKESGALLRARIRYPDGTPVAVAEETIRRMEEAAASLNENPSLRPDAEGALVEHVYSVVGEFADYFPTRGSNLCEVRLELMDSESRGVGEQEIIDAWREGIGECPNAIQYTIARAEVGPVDTPIEIRLLGSNLEEMDEASERIQEKLAEFTGVTDVYSDLIPGKRELRVTLKENARSLGLTLEDVAKQLRRGFYGGEAVRVRRGRDEVIVRVRYRAEERQSIDEFFSKHFRVPGGGEIPFHEAVDVEWTRGYSMIMHQDGKRRVRTYADVDERQANAEQIVASLDREFLPNLVNEYNDMRYQFGGSRKEMDRSLSSLFSGFKLAMIAVYAVLAGLLRSYIQPVVILVAVPLGIVGAVAGHALLGLDVTLMSLFGVVALSGVVVNDALVLLDRVNTGIREGARVDEAVLAAGERRFRAVTLTTLTTVAGLLPLMFERSSQAQAIVPMAVSLVFGISLATALTLFVVPSLYLLVNDVRRAVRWLLHGGAYPAPEFVEEAYRDRLAAESASDDREHVEGDSFRE